MGAGIPRPMWGVAVLAMVKWRGDVDELAVCCAGGYAALNAAAVAGAGGHAGKDAALAVDAGERFTFVAWWATIGRVQSRRYKI
jgi:hypothetical protein